MYDESMCCDCSRMYAFLELIDHLVGDIRHLELETVRTRYELSLYLPHPYGKALRDEIVSDLVGAYYDDPAYQVYIKLFYDNQDPMESDDWVGQLHRAAHGEYGFYRN